MFESAPAKRPSWRRPLLLAVVVYALFLLVNVVTMPIPGVADRLVLFPSTHPTDAMGAARREIPFEGGVLEMWTAQSPGARLVAAPSLYVLSFEGNASRAEWAAAPDAHAWGDHAVEVWSENAPGYGGSTGPARLARMPAAALAAYDEIARTAAGRPIVVNGSSLGSTLALYVAATRPVAGLLIRNPPPLQRLILSPRFGWWNLWIGCSIVAAKIPVEMNSLVNAPRVRAPAAFILSTADEVVPPRLQRMVVESYAGEKKIIELTGATHNAAFDGSHRTELQAASEWLWEKSARPMP
jgi:hypothetical protein